MAGTNVIQLCANQGAGTYGPFTVLGGQYNLMGFSASWGGGNLQLNQMDPSGNWVPVQNGKLTASGTSLVQLAAGQVQAVVTTATGVTGTLAVVPTVTTR